jgi:hypothetical protein
MILIPLELIFAMQYFSNKRKKMDPLNESFSEFDEIGSNRKN